MATRNALVLTALALAAGLTVNAAVAEEVKSNSTETIQKWHGRAGGLAGSDRVAALSAGDRSIGVTYDRAVAERTNMSTDRTTDARVGVTYDEQVAARTNMQRGSTKSVVAAQPGERPAN